MNLWIFVTLERNGKGKYSFIKKNATRRNDKSNLWNSWERSKVAKFRRGVKSTVHRPEWRTQKRRFFCLRGNSAEMHSGTQETLWSISTVCHCKAVTEIILIIHYPMANIVWRVLTNVMLPISLSKRMCFHCTSIFSALMRKLL